MGYFLSHGEKQKRCSRMYFLIKWLAYMILSFSCHSYLTPSSNINIGHDKTLPPSRIKFQLKSTHTEFWHVINVRSYSSLSWKCITESTPPYLPSNDVTYNSSLWQLTVDIFNPPQLLPLPPKACDNKYSLWAKSYICTVCKCGRGF